MQCNLIFITVNVLMNVMITNIKQCQMMQVNQTNYGTNLLRY